MDRVISNGVRINIQIDIRKDKQCFKDPLVQLQVQFDTSHLTPVGLRASPSLSLNNTGQITKSKNRLKPKIFTDAIKKWSLAFLASHQNYIYQNNTLFLFYKFRFRFDLSFCYTYRL